jgi:beta-lactamase class A
MLRRSATLIVCALTFGTTTAPTFAALPAPMAALDRDVRHIASRFPAPNALEVLDLSTGYTVGFNAATSMPAASTIKIPVMVTVFRQLAAGRFDLDHRVTLLERDKDWGSGELCDAPDDTTYPVSELVEKMIDISDNTATNMLIRLVGLHNVNASMTDLGLQHTKLRDDVRTAGWSIRSELRTSPHDLVRLLSLMARRQLVDQWSSNQMISILEGNEFNSLLPEPLPDDVTIAHKTGSLFDTLNDAGIVYEDNAPYVIAVMTTALPSLDIGRSFIHTISRLTFEDEGRLAAWRDANGMTPFAFSTPTTDTSPDFKYWSTGTVDDGVGGGGGGGG